MTSPTFGITGVRRESWDRGFRVTARDPLHFLWIKNGGAQRTGVGRARIAAQVASELASQVYGSAGGPATADQLYQVVSFADTKLTGAHLAGVWWPEGVPVPEG